MASQFCFITALSVVYHVLYGGSRSVEYFTFLTSVKVECYRMQK
jgi:hypothetical protein